LPPPSVELNKAPAKDSVNPNSAKLYLKAGRASSASRVEPPDQGTGNDFVSPAILIGYVGKQFVKNRFFAFEIESGLVQKGVQLNVTNTIFVPGGSPYAPGHTFPSSGVETIQMNYLSNACMLRFYPIDFFYLKAGLNGSIFMNSLYDQQYTAITTAYQFGLGLQFMSRIVGGMIEVEGINDFVPATSHANSMVIYNRTALVNAGIVFNLSPAPKKARPAHIKGGWNFDWEN
jgi:hypothetical protein